MPTLTITPNIGKPGDIVLVGGTGYTVYGTPHIIVGFWDQARKTWWPDPLLIVDGPSFSLRISVPSWADGKYEVRAYDAYQTQIDVRVPFTIGVAPPPETLETVLSLGCASTPLILVCGMVVRDQVRI